jgi:arylformamidase
MSYHPQQASPALVSRRRVIGLGSGLIIGHAVGGAAEPPAAQPASDGSPLVFLNYTQKALDDAYTQEVWAPNADQIRARYTSNSEAARLQLPSASRHAYGPTPIEALDVYRTTRSHAPIHIFLHGGQWRSGAAASWAFLAESFIHAGAHLILPDYAAVQDVGGSLLTMADQVRRAIVWVYKNAITFGGDPRRIYVSGHSSGAHLAAVAMTTDWSTLGLPNDVIASGLCCSGMFDLRAPRLSIRSSYVKFNDETEEALSPIRHLDRLKCPLVVAYASLDSPEFQRQSRDFATALQERGKPLELVRAEGYNHFEAIETLGNPYGLLGRTALRQMHL